MGETVLHAIRCPAGMLSRYVSKEFWITEPVAHNLQPEAETLKLAVILSSLRKLTTALLEEVCAPKASPVSTWAMEQFVHLEDFVNQLRKIVRVVANYLLIRPALSLETV